MSRGNTQIFSPVHPKYSTRFKGKDLPDDNGTEGAESRFVRCRHCRAVNIISGRGARSKGDGWGSNISYVDSGATATTLKYPVVGGAGCWFCGSSSGW